MINKIVATEIKTIMSHMIVSTVALLYNFHFNTKISNLLCRTFSRKFPNCGLKIQNSRFKIQKEKYEKAILENQSMRPL